MNSFCFVCCDVDLTAWDDGREASNQPRFDRQGSHVYANLFRNFSPPLLRVPCAQSDQFAAASRYLLLIALFQRLISNTYLARLITTQKESRINHSLIPPPICSPKRAPAYNTIPGTMIPPTIIASPGTSADSSDLEDNSNPFSLRPSKSCSNKEALSRPKFTFSFDSEHKTSKGSSRRQAASHRRFATPIPRASAPSSRPKYYSGMGPVSENACSDQNEGLTIDTTAARCRSGSGGISPQNGDGPLPQDQLQQGYNCFDSIGAETDDIIKGIVSQLGGLALR